MAYVYHSRDPRPISVTFTKKDVEKFWAKVNMTTGQGPQGDCWEWTGTLLAGGYGRFYACYTVLRAHRVSYLLCYGVNPNLDCVLHRCDNPPCVKPTHLFLGDKAKNRADCLRKGRQARDYSVRGGRREMSPERVLEARKLFSTGEFSQRRLAIIFGVSDTTMHDLLQNRTWSYVV